MDQKIKIIGIIFSVLFAIVSIFLNNKLRKNIENSIKEKQPDSEIIKQSKSYLLFIAILTIVVLFFTIIIILIKIKT